MNAVALGVEQDLHLEVSRAFEESLQDEPIVPERAARLTPRRGKLVRQAPGVAHRAHPLAAAAGRWLDEDRIADRLRRGPQ